MNYPRGWTNLQTHGNIGLEDKHGTSKKTRRGKVLPGMPQEVAPTAFQRSIGKQSGILEEKVLQSSLHGGGDDEGSTNLGGITQTRNTVSWEDLRILWDNGERGHPSHGHRSVEQRPIKPKDVMQFMSHIMALEPGQSQAFDNETAQTMFGVWQGISEIKTGYVPKALSTVQEIWRSFTDEEKAWLALRVSTGSPWCSEWPGVPRVATGVKDRVNRLKCLGNAIVPQIAELLFRQIKATM